MLCLFSSLRYNGIDLSLKLGTKCYGYAEVGAREGLVGRWPLNNVLRRTWKVAFVAWSHQRRHPERGAGGQVGEWEMVGKQRVLRVGVAQVSPLSPLCLSLGTVAPWVGCLLPLCSPGLILHTEAREILRQGLRLAQPSPHITHLPDLRWP